MSYVRLYDGPNIKLFILVGWGRSFLFVAWPTGVFSFAPDFSKLFGSQGSPSTVGQLTESVSLHFLFIMVVIMIYLFVLDDVLTS